MGRKWKLLATASVFLSSVACDQTTKELAVRELKGRGVVNVVGDSARLVYAENPGAFLGLGRDWPDAVRMAVFLGFAMVVSVFLLGLLWRKRDELSFGMQLAIAGLAAGAVGNLIDRMFREGGRVVDFMQLSVGPLQTGIFNVADVWLMLAVPLVLLASMAKERQDKKRAQPSPG